MPSRKTIPSDIEFLRVLIFKIKKDARALLRSATIDFILRLIIDRSLLFTSSDLRES